MEGIFVALIIGAWVALVWLTSWAKNEAERINACERACRGDDDEEGGYDDDDA